MTSRVPTRLLRGNPCVSARPTKGEEESSSQRCLRKRGIMYGDRDLPFNLLVPTGRWTLKTLAILAALLMVLGALLVLSAPGQAAGQDPFVSAVSIEGNTLVPVDPLQVGPYTEGESTSGTFRVNFNRPIDLKSVTVSESVSH
jgi:hypothetical protein